MNLGGRSGRAGRVGLVVAAAALACCLALGSGVGGAATATVKDPDLCRLPLTFTSGLPGAPVVIGGGGIGGGGIGGGGVVGPGGLGGGDGAVTPPGGGGDGTGGGTGGLKPTNFDGPPKYACMKAGVALLDSQAKATTPKGGINAILRVTVQSDPQQASAGVVLTVAIPVGAKFTTSKWPTGFTRTAVTDPFLATKAIIDPVDDGSHSAIASGKLTIPSGSTRTVDFPVALAGAGTGTVELQLEPSSTAFTAAATRATWFGSSLPLNWTASGGGNSIQSVPSVAVMNAPKAWNASSPASFDVPARKLTRVDSSGAFNGATWVPSVAPLDSLGRCPGGSSKSGGVCPGAVGPVTGSGGPQPAARRQARRAHPASETCLTGQLVYSDPDGVHPSVNVAVEVFDDNPIDDEELATAFTDWSGKFRTCFDNAETSLLESGTADVKLTFRTQSDRFQVVNNGAWGSGRLHGNYVLETATMSNVASGTVALGSYTPASETFQKAFRIYDLLNRAWAWTNVHSPGAGTCWSPGDCNQKSAMWTPDSDTWPHYGWCALTFAYICLPGTIAPPNAPADSAPYTALHETGHALWFDMNGDLLLMIGGGNPCPNPHYVNTNENLQCAWMEGWPTFFASTVLGRLPSQRDASLSDNSTWQSYGHGTARGSNVEARVIGALWDLQDSSNEAPWDRVGYGSQMVWDAFRKHHPKSLQSMVQWAMKDEGADAGSDAYLSTLYGNTLNFSNAPFLDPLKAGPNWYDPEDWLKRPLPPRSPPSLTESGGGNNSEPPWDTTNGQDFKWSRGGPLCADSILVGNYGDWSQGYRNTAFGVPFTIGSLLVSVYRNPDMTDLIAKDDESGLVLPFRQDTSYTEIRLPLTPATVYVSVMTVGSNPSPVPDGDSKAPIQMHYRLYPKSCRVSPPGTAQPVPSPTRHGVFGLSATAGTKYDVTFAPSGNSTAGKPQRTALAVGLAGWSGPCVGAGGDQAGASGCNCLSASSCTQGKPVASISQSSASAGKTAKLSFTAQSTGVYEVTYDSLSGLGKGTLRFATAGG